jgi:hypothetical protein
VPKLACLECPRRGVENTLALVVGVPDVGLPGLCGTPASSSPSGEVMEPLRTAVSMAVTMPLGEGTGFAASSIGVEGLDRCGAMSSGSMSSGGRRSFSISDLRLQ